MFARAATTQPSATPVSEPKRRLVFINAHESDKRDALELREQLGSFDTVMPLSFFDRNASGRSLREDLRANFMACDALATVWGTAPETWIRAMLREYRKLEFRRKSPLRANFIVPVGPRLLDHADIRRLEFFPMSVEVATIDETAKSLRQALLVGDVHPRSLSAAASTPEEGNARIRREIETVDVSAFAPRSGRAGETVLVQILLHRPEDRAAAEVLAEDADPDTKARGATTLATELARGQEVGIELDAPELSVDPPIQYLTWRGNPRACQFLVRIPDYATGELYHLRARVLLDSVPIGMLRFTLRAVSRHEPIDSRIGVRGDFAKRYSYAFLSYASPDRAEVIKRATMLGAVGVEFFLDLLSLDPGERWERKLYREIDRCDVFFLFWSSYAASSDWVIREAEYALHRQDTSTEEMPDIRPVILEGPPPVPPPDSLKKIHFNDLLSYVLAGVEAERRRSGD
jgi:hypothetical protein